VLMVMGRIASGKSTLARALGEELGWDVYSSDHLRKKMAGFPIYERSSEAARSHLYSLAMTRQTYQRLLSSAAEQVRKGQSIILDATFAQRAHRDLAAVTFRRRGIHFRFLEAQAGDDAVKRRLKAREAAADEVSDARFEDFQMLTSLYDPPRELAPPNCVGIRTNVPASETVCRALIGLIRAQLTASE
jgi:predicted kinase